MNSSPPKRASSASAPTTSRRRTDIAVSNVSPMPWPRLSLTDLKLSRSMNSSDDLARLGVGEDGVDAVDQLGAVGQPGEVVVGRRPLQRSAVRRCSVTSSMWVIASDTPSSSVTATRVRAHTNSPSLRR